MWEVGKYRVREVRKGGSSTFYPQRLMRSLWLVPIWENFFGFCEVPFKFDSYEEAVDFINEHLEHIESNKVTKVIYHNVEI